MSWAKRTVKHEAPMKECWRDIMAELGDRLVAKKKDLQSIYDSAIQL